MNDLFKLKSAVKLGTILLNITISANPIPTLICRAPIRNWCDY